MIKKLVAEGTDSIVIETAFHGAALLPDIQEARANIETEVGARDNLLFIPVFI